MRLVIAAAIAALAALPSAALPQPVATQPLARGEVLLEVNAVGSARTPAALATVRARIESTAGTEDEARASSQAALQRVVAAARAIGVAEEDIATSAGAAIVRGPTGGGSAAHMPRTATVSASVEIRLRAPERAAELRRALEEAGATVSPPVFAPADEAAARRAARAEALATARADAEAYAAGMGMRVLRIVRVTERVGMDWLSLMMGPEPPWISRQDRAETGGQAETNVIIGVDFALGPQ